MVDEVIFSTAESFSFSPLPLTLRIVDSARRAKPMLITVPPQWISLRSRYMTACETNREPQLVH